MIKMLKCLSKQIKDELDKAEEYSSDAMKLKDHPEYEHLYRTYLKLATQEIEHADFLLEDMTILYNVYKKSDNEDINSISILFEYMYDEIMDYESKVKLKMEMAKKSSSY